MILIEPFFKKPARKQEVEKSDPDNRVDAAHDFMQWELFQKAAPDDDQIVIKRVEARCELEPFGDRFDGRCIPREDDGRGDENKRYKQSLLLSFANR
jgi:hypothetical protein